MKVVFVISIDVALVVDVGIVAVVVAVFVSAADGKSFIHTAPETK